MSNNDLVVAHYICVSNMHPVLFYVIESHLYFIIQGSEANHHINLYKKPCFFFCSLSHTVSNSTCVQTTSPQGHTSYYVTL
jgi:hypothetical protein